MTETCAQAGCETDAEFAFYHPETGETMSLCGDHLEEVNDFFGTRSWLLAGYAVPIEEADEYRLPRTPVQEHERRARRSVDQLLRGGSPSHHH
ncbi:MAG: hypothetical protein ABEJ74_05365 [Haloferacaceae archaeon]